MDDDEPCEAGSEQGGHDAVVQSVQHNCSAAQHPVAIAGPATAVMGSAMPMIAPIAAGPTDTEELLGTR
ncbi:MAG: hypothetical protein ABI706_07185 [Ilumatobacteraceae bacterium]